MQLGSSHWKATGRATDRGSPGNPVRSGVNHRAARGASELPQADATVCEFAHRPRAAPDAGLDLDHHGSCHGTNHNHPGTGNPRSRHGRGNTADSIATSRRRNRHDHRNRCCSRRDSGSCRARKPRSNRTNSAGYRRTVRNRTDRARHTGRPKDRGNRSSPRSKSTTSARLLRTKAAGIRNRNSRNRHRRRNSGSTAWRSHPAATRLPARQGAWSRNASWRLSDSRT